MARTWLQKLFQMYVCFWNWYLPLWRCSGPPTGFSLQAAQVVFLKSHSGSQVSCCSPSCSEWVLKPCANIPPSLPLIPFPTSILYTPASISPASYTLSNFAHAVPWQSVLCYLISCRFLLQQHLHQEVLTDHPPLKQESLQGLFQTCLYFPHFFLLLPIYLNTISLFYQNRISLRSWICLILTVSSLTPRKVSDTY